VLNNILPDILKHSKLRKKMNWSASYNPFEDIISFNKEEILKDKNVTK
jgi:hypothetical protein